MKRLGALVLSFSVFFPTLISQSAFALDANRHDVNDAREHGERLSAVERLELKSRIALAYLLRADLRWRQSMLDIVGLDHQLSPGTFMLGMGTVAAEILVGATAARFLDQEAFGRLDRDIEDNYVRIKRESDVLKGLQAEAQTLRAEGVTAVETVIDDESALSELSRKEQRLARAERGIETVTERVNDLGRQQSLLFKEGKFLPRMARWTRLSLGAVVVPITIYETVASAYQLVYDPEHVDEIERQLTDFIDDARVTLDTQ